MIKNNFTYAVVLLTNQLGTTCVIRLSWVWFWLCLVLFRVWWLCQCRWFAFFSNFLLKLGGCVIWLAFWLCSFTGNPRFFLELKFVWLYFPFHKVSSPLPLYPKKFDFFKSILAFPSLKVPVLVSVFSFQQNTPQPGPYGVFTDPYIPDWVGQRSPVPV